MFFVRHPDLLPGAAGTKHHKLGASTQQKCVSQSWSHRPENQVSCRAELSPETLGDSPSWSPAPCASRCSLPRGRITPISTSTSHSLICPSCECLKRTLPLNLEPTQVVAAAKPLFPNKVIFPGPQRLGCRWLFWAVNFQLVTYTYSSRISDGIRLVSME